MSPRPILKRAPSPRSDSNSELPFYGINAVHFPPNGSLAQAYDAYSSSCYDRSPIIVSPNSCALPERGCPGRTYTLGDDQAPSYNSSSKMAPPPRGSHLHPRMLAQYQAQSYSYPTPERSSSSAVPPPLIPDLSSESEESDGFISPPPPRPPYFSRNDKYPSQYPYDPHYAMPPTTMPPTALYSQPPPSPESRNRHRRERERERDHRIRRSTAPGEVAVDDPGYDDDRDVPTPSSSPTLAPRRRSRCRKSMSRTGSSFCEQDDSGCLGGF